MFLRQLSRKFSGQASASTHKFKQLDGINLINQVRDSGFTIHNLKYTGPVFILDKPYLWDVPQFGVGGPKGSHLK